MVEGRRVYRDKHPDGRPALARGMVARLQAATALDQRRARRKLEKFRRDGEKFRADEERIERLRQEHRRKHPPSGPMANF